MSHARKYDSSMGPGQLGEHSKGVDPIETLGKVWDVGLCKASTPAQCPESRPWRLGFVITTG